tara:strand:+ start:1243 stop:2172 length:930 start_codon:yes stop_codon:yes gene_type:complete
MNLKSSNQTYLYEHDDLFNELVRLNFQNKLPNKILLSGEKGIGKCTFAYHFINCIHSSREAKPYDLKKFEINSENKSFLLTQNKSNPNFELVDIDEDKKKIDINKIRNLILRLNKSSFNNIPRFVLIDNIEFLNTNSINALLKVLEEPNDNIFFILINNNKKILPTLKSRCLNYKISLSFEQSIRIVNKIIDEDVSNLINQQLICNYSTPGKLLQLISYGNEFKVDLKNINLKELISLIIHDKHFKKDNSIKELTYYLIELYFRSTISIKNIKLINLYSLFIKKIDSSKKFNLDDEVIFMEFNESILNG